MLKRLMGFLVALLLLEAVGAAEVFEGKTAAFTTVAVCSEASGILSEPGVQVGQCVAAGDRLANLQSEKTFAAEDGTVTLIYADAGDEVSGEVLELAPAERYTVHCTVEKAYQSAESTLVHSGERVYVKCTSDGTHRAIGFVTQIDGKTYQVLTVGGELYVGETVYLYRDADFTASQRIGIGTVTVSDTRIYQAEGQLTALCVSEGDSVERGQLLYETGGGEVFAEVGGVVTALNINAGDSVDAGQIIAEIVPDGEICVEIQVEQAALAHISVGDVAWLTFAGQQDEEASPGCVVDIFGIAQSELYTVRIRPESGAVSALGMSVEVRI